LLSDKGRYKCYNTFEEIQCLNEGQAFFGQDGNYSGPQQKYEVGPDDLVVPDINSGLIWQKSDEELTRDWYSAYDYCENLVYAVETGCTLPVPQPLMT
jgi:hypothetical protein